MDAHQAAEELRRRLGGSGVFDVSNDDGMLVVRVSDVRAGEKIRSQYGGNYNGWPISVVQASTSGILTIYPA